MTPSEVKKQLRSHLRATRAALPPERRDRALMALQTALTPLLDQYQPRTLGVYAPILDELNILATALSFSEATGTRLALPVMRKKEVTYVLWTFHTPISLGAHGLWEPEGQSLAQPPEMLLLPCVGASREGWRLGYGGGSFDKYLAEHPDTVTCGIVFEECLVDTPPIEPHDCLLTHMLVM